ncbi:hypothetical protein XENTR_v10013511 [Xenopus tropicalis]|nr:hypothetical protein XENTR_v10013511 [Xenopus tropicalis]
MFPLSAFCNPATPFRCRRLFPVSGKYILAAAAFPALSYFHFIYCRDRLQLCCTQSGTLSCTQSGTLSCPSYTQPLTPCRTFVSLSLSIYYRIPNNPAFFLQKKKLIEINIYNIYFF